MTNRTTSTRPRVLVALLAIMALLAVALTGTAASAGSVVSAGDDDGFTLALLHNNDGESQLIDSGDPDFGGAARFQTVVTETRRANKRAGNESILVSSGDNFLAGPEFNASLEDPRGRWFDAIALAQLDYDAIQLGNHDFDFGPETLADFISDGFRPRHRATYIGGNLDFTLEPSLQALADDGIIVDKRVVEKDDEEIGIVGAVTPNLPFISSPGNTIVDPDVAGVLQSNIDELTADGVEIIIVISHLQGIDDDIALAAQLDDVDAMVAGGGSEILANPGDLLVPGDAIDKPYPVVAADATGDPVPVVTTGGNYKYLGELVLDFDEDGNVLGWSGGPIRVAGGDEPDGVRPNRRLQRRVVDPVAEYVDGLATQIVATSEVGLDARRDFIRAVETNEGNLIADAYFAAGTDLAGSFGVPAPDVALTNGGGIRNDNIIPAGNLSVLNTFEMLPFGNFATIVEGVTHQAFKDLLENAVSRITPQGERAGSGTGRFAQISGFTVEYDSTLQAAVIDASGNITTPGQRILNVSVDGGPTIVSAGVVLTPAATLTVATNQFSATGGDQWDFGTSAALTGLGVTDQQALQTYLENLGTVTAAQYPEDAGPVGSCDGDRIVNSSALCGGP